MDEFNLKELLIYLDDIVVFIPYFSEAVQRLISYLQRLKKTISLNLKLQCEFIKPQGVYLGHSVSKDGIKTNPIKIETILKLIVPTFINEVRSV